MPTNNKNQQCHICGSNSRRLDEKEGTVYCGNGHVLATDNFQMAVEFGGTTGQKMQGNVVNPEVARAHHVHNGKQCVNENSITIRTNRYRKAIDMIANDLGIGQQLREQALRYYFIASGMKYQNKFDDPTSLTQGRQTLVVAAACLYMVCRMERQPILLIDFSDVIGVDLFKIAEVFQLFKKHIRVDGHILQVPIIDPSWFIERFCRKLGFEEKEKEVRDTAIRLLQSMNRSWISTGRHPSGLCGAAILIAAKYHGFRRTTNEIVKVAHVCMEVVRKRVNEFKHLKTAQLTKKQFRIKELESGAPEKFDYEDYEPPKFIMEQDALEMEADQRLELHDKILKKEE